MIRCNSKVLIFVSDMPIIYRDFNHKFSFIILLLFVANDNLHRKKRYFIWLFFEKKKYVLRMEISNQELKSWVEVISFHFAEHSHQMWNQ